MNFKGNEYDANTQITWEDAFERLVPKCKVCGSEDKLGTVYKPITFFMGPYKLTEYCHDYYICEDC